MMMIHFRFDVRSGERLSADTLGHVQIEGPGGILKSSERGGMSMVVLGATDLLNGLRKLLVDNKGEREIVFADSSFTVGVKVDPRGELVIDGIGAVPAEEVWRAAERDIVSFLDAAVNQMPSDDPARGDASMAALFFRQEKAKRDRPA